MSGPKSYSPPPSYSMQVFDGKLNEVFLLQSRLKMLCAEIESAYVADSKLDIHFDCKSELNRKRKQIDKVLKVLLFDYRGTFGQETYNRIDGEIRARIAELQNLHHECELIKNDFAAKKSDYEAYLSYLLFYNNSQISLDDFKSQIQQYLKISLETKSPEIFLEAAGSINRIEFEKAKAKFDFGFERRLDAEKQAVINHILEKEKAIDAVKDKIGDKIVAGLRATTSESAKIVSEESNLIVEKIKSLIRACDQAAVKKGYKAELQNLTESESLKDVYFFKELHDSILEAEKTRKAKTEINKLLVELNLQTFHASLQNEKQNIIRLCLRSLELSSVSKSEIDNLRLKIKQAKKQSEARFEEDEVAEKERLFLKSQVVLCLENLGYEVMDDLEVIDFEKENDLLLKIRNQENYLNLKFKEDGSMRYIFQIPENEDDLSTDQKDLKLHEMKVTCDEFQNVLSDLAQMGLNIDLKSAKPIELESIVTVPKSQRGKLKTKTERKQETRQLREKYLNR